MKFLIIFDPYKEGAEKLSHEIAAWCKNRDIHIGIQPEVIESDKERQTIALVLGGDGFIMRQAKRLQKSRIPLLGINFGRVGFLAVAEPQDWKETLECILRGEWQLKKRTMLSCVHLNQNGDVIHRFEAANDVYIRHPKRMVSLSVAVNGRLAFQDLHADGIVVCTPMGSTGYYLAAGGKPFPSGIGIQGICPLAMNTSSLVQEEEDIIEIVLKDIGSLDKEPAFLFIDGEDTTMCVGDKIIVKKSKRHVYFVVPKGFSWISVAQRKLGLAQ